MDGLPAIEAWWSKPASQVASALGSSIEGLSSRKAGEMLRSAGPNRIAAQQAPGWPRLLLRQVESPLVLILVFAAAVSLIVREWTEAAIILLIVGCTTALSFYQEHRASRAMESLRGRLQLRSQVLRDGKPVSVDSTDIVPGDVVLLSAGNLVPADGLIIEARDFLVTQAALTGESFPVEKHEAPSLAGAALPERSNAVFLGTSVRSGNAKVLVVQTGRATQFGSIANRLGEAEEESGFEHGVRRFGYLLTRIMMAIVICVLAANMAMERSLLDSLLFSIALAVGLTPELLPAIISVTLAAGAQRMAQDGVIVRRLSAIETLGAVNVLCTDKTGTLTLGVVELNAALDPQGGQSYEVFELALTNSALETGIENPLDAAIIATAASRGVAMPQAVKVDEIPYDFMRKRLTIVIAAGERHRIVTKGAFDTVLACCDAVSEGGAPVRLDDARRKALQDFYAAKGAQGYRVLGLATRDVDPKPHYAIADEAGMVFAGFLLFLDPLKPDIGKTIASLKQLGISIKIITGDNRHVAAHIAEAVGLKGRLLAGQELAQTSDEALLHLCEQAAIFAEVDPQQKERIVRALQLRGHTVAYLGDGINDAPSLRRADVGITVDSAVDVARESADMVLLKRNLEVLIQGVIDGRRTFANTLKYISITTSANFGNMISMAIGALFLPFLPLSAAQILLNNFLSDIPSVAIATDGVDPETVALAPRWDIAGIRNFMIVFGLVSTLFDLLTFALLVAVLHAPEPVFQTTWFLVSLLTELAVVLVLRTHRPFWRSRPGRTLWIATAVIGGLAIAMATPLLAPMMSVFGFVPLTPGLLAASFAIVAAYIATTEVAKHFYFARVQKAPAGRRARRLPRSQAAQK